LEFFVPASIALFSIIVILMCYEIGSFLLFCFTDYLTALFGAAPTK